MMGRMEELPSSENSGERLRFTVYRLSPSKSLSNPNLQSCQFCGHRSLVNTACVTIYSKMYAFLFNMYLDIHRHTC